MNAHGSGASVLGGVCGTRKDAIAQRTAAPVEMVISDTGMDFKFSLAHITANATTTQPMVPIVRMIEKAFSRSASVEPSSWLR